MRSALNTLGVILQVNGVIYFLPILAAFYFDEVNGVAAFSLMALISISIGFLLSSLFKSEEHNYVSLALTTVLAFTLLSLIGSVPYIMMGHRIFGEIPPGEVVVNALFDSTSGFTTTGLTTISNYETLPKSLLLYRSITQWLGGVNILFIVSLFFIWGNVPHRIVPALFGLERVSPSLRFTFIQLSAVYAILTSIFVVALLVVGVNPFITLNIVFSTISTGGFTPTKDLEAALGAAGTVIIAVCMVGGAINFSIYESFIGRARGRLHISEVGGWLIFVALLISFYVIAKGGLVAHHTIFNFLSAATTAGLQIGPWDAHGRLELIFIILLMFIGGNTFSTAGGLKALRFLLLLKTSKWFIERLILPPMSVRPLRFAAKEIKEEDLFYSLTLLLLGLTSVMVSAMIISTTNDFPIGDAMFESISAWSNTGLSVGISQSSDVVGKLALIVVMIIGRIEVIPLLSILLYLGRTLVQRARYPA
ncbi:MAG: potassium transporter TrkG [Nitrososphaerota archaeon]|nr:potassium transporter TrkG [Nitrososphaerota archaeon]